MEDDPGVEPPKLSVVGVEEDGTGVEKALRVWVGSEVNGAVNKKQTHFIQKKS